MRMTMVAAAACMTVLAACGPKTPGEIAAHERHENFESLGKAYKTLGDEAKKPAPDAAVMQAQAVKISELAQDLPDWFPEGSGPQDGVRTHALEAVWTRPTEFQIRALNLQAKAEAARVAGLLGVDAMQPLVGSLGGACKGCHDNFRKK